ncbi:Afadin and alpha-actinin-binding-domain-containing protein [Amylostereum chailletii]|nr:Afadin and alpha-actinin-binding-domain-containing protein [Amylostereum chailletii]
MTETPKKLVHWALQYSNSPVGSPFSEASSTDSVTSTSTLQYVNSQLVAHGFSLSPGLSLDGLSNGDSEKVVRCLFAMLSQRMEDMTRTEDLSTKLRTLSYDHDRLLSMHKSAKEKVADSEREANTHKSKLANTTRALAQSEAAHKHTTGELQRTRTTLQALRATHQAELKKKEKEVERMAERWSKLSDTQLKVGTLRSGMTMTGANVQIVEGSASTSIKSRGIVEVALEQAEEACKQLREENVALKVLVVDVANAVQKILHKAVTEDPDNFDYPPPLTSDDIFSLGPPDAAFDKLSTLLTSLRNAIAEMRLGDEAKPSASNAASSSDDSKAHIAEVERLQKTIGSLRSELENAQKDSRSHAARAKDLLDRISEQQAVTPPAQQAVTPPAQQAVTPPAVEEGKHLDEARADLEQQRHLFSEAAVRLSKDRAELDDERLKFLEEKRAWQLDSMLTEPHAPPPIPSEHFPPPEPTTPHKSPRKTKIKHASPRKSPAKAILKHRNGTSVFRRSSAGLGLPPSSKVVPSYETEVIPSMATSLLPTSFVLPPPSPQSRLPPQIGSLLAHVNGTSPEPDFDFDAPDAGPSAPAQSTTPPHSEAHQESTTPPPVPAPIPQTPGTSHRPFPMAKPFAPRMIHAYSPAKPSPLSRILMLGNSPEGGPGPKLSAAAFDTLDTLTEEDLEPIRTPSASASLPATTDDSPLREKRLEKNVDAAAKPSRAKPSSKAAGKAKAPPPAATAAPTKKSISSAMDNGAGGSGASKRGADTVLEKENTIKRRLKGPAMAKTAKPPGAGSQARSTTVASEGPAPTAKAAGGATTGGKPGPRRVPIDSAEAAHNGPGWRG